MMPRYVFEDERETVTTAPRYVLSDEQPTVPELRQGEPPSLMDGIRRTFYRREERAAEAVQAIVDAEAFGIRPSQAHRYRKAIDRGVKIHPQAAALRSTLTERVRQSWDTGVNQNRLGEMGWKFVETGDQRYIKKLEEIQGKIPTEAETFIPESRLESAIRSAAKLTPMMADVTVEGAWKGLELGTGLAAITALLGQAGPQVAIPEEILTVPGAFVGGFKVGSMAGAFEASMRKEGGLALAEIMSIEDEEGNRIDPDIARASASGVGLINAALELAQLKTLMKTIPGARKLYQGAAVEAIKELAAKKSFSTLAKRYAGAVGTETAQEVAQESVNIVFEEFSKRLNNKFMGSDIDPTTATEVIERLRETAVESAQGFAVMAAPGTVVTGVAGRGKAEAVSGAVREPVEQEAPVQAPVTPETPKEKVELDSIISGQTEAEDVFNTIRGEGGLLDLKAEVSVKPVLERLRTLPGDAVEAMQNLEDIGRSVWAEGKTSLQSFTARMREVLGDLWERFKDAIKSVYESVKAFNVKLGERGSIGRMPEGGRLELNKEGKPVFNVDVYLHELKSYVEFGEPGQRMQNVEGEWFGVPSTYPDFMKNRGWTQKEVLAALEKALKGGKVTPKQQGIITAALTQAEEMFYKDIEATKGEFLDATEFLESEEEARQIAEAALEKLMGKLKVKEAVETPEKAVERITKETGKELSQLKRLLGERTQETWKLQDALEAEKKAKTAETTALVEKHRAKVEELRGRIKELRQRQVTERVESVKARIRQVTGQTRPERLIPEDEALKASLRRAQQAARTAYRAGDQAGVARERARLREIFERARAKTRSTSERNALREMIAKEIKGTAPKSQAGKPAGKYTREIQRVLDTFRDALRLPREEAGDKVVAYLEKYSEKEEYPSEAEVIEHKIYQMVLRMESMDTPDLQQLLGEIRLMKTEGRMLGELKRLSWKEDIEDKAAQAVDVISGGGGVPETIITTGISGERSKLPTVQTLVSGIHFIGWRDVMDMLSRREKESQPYQSALNVMTDVQDEKNAEKRGREENIRKVADTAKAIYGFRNDHEMMKRFRQDNEEVHLGWFVNAYVQEIELRFTRAEARKRFMEFQDPTLRQTLIEGMGYTPEIEAAITEFLSPEDKRFADAQIQFYRDYYQGVNEVYGDIFGVDLPFNEFYSPIRREGVATAQGSTFGEFMQELPFRAAVTSGSLKARVRNIHPLRRMSDLAVLEQHVAEMEHFKAWAKKVRELNGILKHPKVQEAVKVYEGKETGGEILHIINRFIGDFTRGGIELAGRLGLFDKLRANYTRSVLAVKPSIMFKQLTSFIAYAEQMPVTDFIKGVANFWKSPIENWHFLKEHSTMFAERGKHMERDIKTAMRSREFSAFREKLGFLDMLMLNVQAGDQGAIAIGGWAYYKHLRAKGMTTAQAIKEFEDFTSATQQSADLDQLSHVQRMGSMAKLFTMFLSAPNQYFRKEVGAIRNLIAGRGSKRQHIKTLMIYHVLLPMFFQYVSDWFNWDKDEQLRAVILGPLNGIFIIGDALDSIIRRVLGLRDYDKEIAIFGWIDDLGKAVDEALEWIAEGDMTAEDFYRATRGLGGAVGGVTGLPTKQAVDLLRATDDALHGEYEQGLYEYLGYSPPMVEKRQKAERAVRR